METTDLFKLLTSSIKWYAGIPGRKANTYLNAQSANRIKKRFLDGNLSDRKIEQIFNCLGYYKNKTQWTNKVL